MASSIKGTSGESLDHVINYVNDVLVVAGKYDLEVEVIATAMIYLKENPEASISDALSTGLSDWDV